MSTDTLSEVLRVIRLTGAVFFRVKCTTPWVAEAPDAQLVAPSILPGAEHVIEYHVVTRGSCWGGLLEGEGIALQEGDVLVFPQGDPHVLASKRGMRAAPDLSVHRMPDGGQLPYALNVGAAGPVDAELVCGFIGCDARPFNPLLATLPRVLHVPRAGAENSHIAALVRLAVDECEGRSAGGQTMLARLSELLFIEVVRWYVRQLAPETTGWLAGLRDEVVGRALQAMHERPEHDWTLDELAKHVAQSRSLLAERFQHYVQVPPMQYLARWRVQLAGNYLSGSSLTIAEIAQRVGYGSEAALGRTFKRWTSVTPSAWRAGARGVSEPSELQDRTYP